MAENAHGRPWTEGTNKEEQVGIACGVILERLREHPDLMVTSQQGYHHPDDPSTDLPFDPDDIERTAATVLRGYGRVRNIVWLNGVTYAASTRDLLLDGLRSFVPALVPEAEAQLDS